MELVFVPSARVCTPSNGVGGGGRRINSSHHPFAADDPNGLEGWMASGEPSSPKEQVTLQGSSSRESFCLIRGCDRWEERVQVEPMCKRGLQGYLACALPPPPVHAFLARRPFQRRGRAGAGVHIRGLIYTHTHLFCMHADLPSYTYMHTNIRRSTP